MVARVQVRTHTNDEGNKLLRIVRRSSGSVVTWRRPRWFCCPRKAWTSLGSPR